jgi:hypothetical protein
MWTLAFITAITVVGVGVWFQFLSTAEYSEPPKGSYWRVIGPFAGKEEFTQRGWRYRKLGVTLTIAGVALGIILFGVAGQ